MKNINYKKILVTHDGSETSYSSIPHALAIASAFNAEVLLLTVLNPVAKDTAIMGTHGLYNVTLYENFAKLMLNEKTIATRQLKKIKTEFAEKNLHNVHILTIEGTATDSILEVAESENCDLIVMATHGRSGIGRVIIGSVADDVIRHAVCPVLVVHPTK